MFFLLILLNLLFTADHRKTANRNAGVTLLPLLILSEVLIKEESTKGFSLVCEKDVLKDPVDQAHGIFQSNFHYEKA